MRTLGIPQRVFDAIVRSVSASPLGFETGVTLFGASVEPDCDVVLAIAGPGRHATYEPAHYSGDETHANEIYGALRDALPGIRWLGECHVHPKGMTWLSRGDLRTVRQILTGTDATLHPDQFIVGVMQRRDGTVHIYPFHFTRERLHGMAMELQIVDSDAPEVQEARRKAIERGEQHGDRSNIRTKSEGSGAALPQARRFHRLREW